MQVAHHSIHHSPFLALLLCSNLLVAYVTFSPLEINFSRILDCVFLGETCMKMLAGWCITLPFVAGLGAVTESHCFPYQSSFPSPLATTYAGLNQRHRLSSLRNLSLWSLCFSQAVASVLDYLPSRLGKDHQVTVCGPLEYQTLCFLCQLWNSGGLKQVMRVTYLDPLNGPSVAPVRIMSLSLLASVLAKEVWSDQRAAMA